jgi:tetratricopeptide (TPR) repeat protein
MIVKDEERVLDACLASIGAIVDEIVVVDTGSGDRSRNIAVAHGARLIDFGWTGDFGTARNVGLAAARGEWILYIDADERLAPVERTYVEDLLDAPDLVAGRLWLRPKAGFTLSREYRLFRNDPEIRFQGIIHEKVSPDIHRLAKARGYRIEPMDLRLEHVGYDGPQDRKHRRNLPLLQAELALRPDNAYNWHHLGRVLDGLGDRPGALAAWRRSLEVIRRWGLEQASGWVVYADLIGARETGLPEACALHREAVALFPHNPLLRFCGAMLESRAGRDGAAIEIFQQIAAIDSERFCDPLTGFDKRLFGEFTWAALGSCFFNLARYAESAAWFAKAAAADPDSLEYRTKSQLAAAKAANLSRPAGSASFAPLTGSKARHEA